MSFKQFFCALLFFLFAPVFVHAEIFIKDYVSGEVVGIGEDGTIHLRNTKSDIPRLKQDDLLVEQIGIDITNERLAVLLLGRRIACGIRGEAGAAVVAVDCMVDFSDQIFRSARWIKCVVTELDLGSRSPNPSGDSSFPFCDHYSKGRYGVVPLR